MSKRGKRKREIVHRLALRGLMNAGSVGDSRCRQTGRTWPRSLSLFSALFHYRLDLCTKLEEKKLNTTLFFVPPIAELTEKKTMRGEKS